MELKRVYKYKGLYNKIGKDFKGNSVMSAQVSRMILALLQSVTLLPVPGPKPPDKEALSDISARKLVGQEVENTHDFASNPKENPIQGYKIINTNIFLKLLAFFPNVYIAVRKNVYVYFNMTNPEDFFQKNYMSNVCYISKQKTFSIT